MNKDLPIEDYASRAEWVNKQPDCLIGTGSTPKAFLKKAKSGAERWIKAVKENDIKIEGWYR